MASAALFCVALLKSFAMFGSPSDEEEEEELSEQLNPLELVSLLDGLSEVESFFAGSFSPSSSFCIYNKASFPSLNISSKSSSAIMSAKDVA